MLGLILQVHLIVAAGPALSFLGVYYGYAYLKELRAIARDGVFDLPAAPESEPDRARMGTGAPTDPREGYVPFQGFAGQLA